jgi:hypothetical protein
MKAFLDRVDATSFIQIFVVVSVVVLTFTLIWVKVPDSDMFKMLASALVTIGFATVINFLMGSSTGSKDKDKAQGDALKQALSNQAPPPNNGSTAIKAVLALFAVMFALSFALPAFAQVPQLKKPAITGNPIEDIKTDLGGSASGGNNLPKLTGDPRKDALALWQKIVKASDLDIAYAIAMAKAVNAASPTGITTGAGMRLQCLTAIQTLNQQANGANLKNGDGTVMTRPDPALFSDAETLAEIIDAVQPGGPLWTSCSGAAQLAATNTIAFINALVSGAAGLAILAPK